VSGQRGLVDQRSFFDSNVSGENLSTYYRITRGEFAYNRSRMNGYPFGAVKSLRSCNSGAVSTLYICFSVNACICDPNYFEQLCEAGMLDSELRKRTQVGGRAHGLLNITLDDFFGIPIQLPKISEQRRIAEVLGLIDQEIALLTKFKTKVEQQKRGVMERLLSGELPIPEDVVERLNLEAEKEEQQRAEDAKLAEATTEDAS
jgi:type I restriction enzyme S subunit